MSSNSFLPEICNPFRSYPGLHVAQARALIAAQPRLQSKSLSPAFSHLPSIANQPLKLEPSNRSETPASAVPSEESRDGNDEDEIGDVRTRETTVMPPNKMKAPILPLPKKGKGRVEQKERPREKRAKKRDVGPKREPSVELGGDSGDSPMSDR